MNINESNEPSVNKIIEEEIRSSSSSKLKQDSKESSLNLEEIVKLTNKIGLEYASAKKEFDRLDLFKNVVRARISTRIENENPKISEARLKRFTDSDPEYIKYLDRLLEAKNNMESLKIRYDSYKNLFDAKRSLLSYQKAEMKLL